MRYAQAGRPTQHQQHLFVGRIAAIKGRRAAVPPAPTALTDEVELLQRGRRTLSTQPAETLALVEQHAKLYPRSALQQERDALEVEGWNGRTPAAVEAVALRRDRLCQRRSLSLPRVVVARECPAPAAICSGTEGSGPKKALGESLGLRGPASHSRCGPCMRRLRRQSTCGWQLGCGDRFRRVAPTGPARAYDSRTAKRSSGPAMQLSSQGMFCSANASQELRGGSLRQKCDASALTKEDGLVLLRVGQPIKSCAIWKVQ